MANETNRVGPEDTQSTPTGQPSPTETAGANTGTDQAPDLEAVRLQAYQEAVDYLTRSEEGRRLLADANLLPASKGVAKEERTEEQTAGTATGDEEMDKILRTLQERDPAVAQALAKVYELSRSLTPQLEKVVEERILPLQEQLELRKVGEEIAEIRQEYPDASDDQIRTAMMVQKALLGSADIDKVPPLIRIFEDLRRAWVGGSEEEIKRRVLAELNKGRGAPTVEGAGISSSAEEEPKDYEEYARLMKERYGISTRVSGL